MTLLDNPSWQPAGLAANALAPELCAAFFRRVYLDTVRVFPKSPSFDKYVGKYVGENYLEGEYPAFILAIVLYVLH